VDESPYRFLFRYAQAVAFPDFLVPLKLRIAEGNKMLPAPRLAPERRSDILTTACNIAVFSFCHT
jgi:hypothetical protein